MGFQVKSLIAIEIWKNTLWPKPNSHRAEMAKFVLTTHDVYENLSPILLAECAARLEIKWQRMTYLCTNWVSVLDRSS